MSASSVVSAQLSFFAALAAEAANKFSSAVRSPARFAKAASTAFGRGRPAGDAELPPEEKRFFDGGGLLFFPSIRSLGAVAGTLTGFTAAAAGSAGTALGSAAGCCEASSSDDLFAAFAPLLFSSPL